MDAGFIVALTVGPVLMAVVGGVCRAAASGRIPRNRSVGIRLPSLLRSEQRWEAGHRAAAAPALAAAGVLAVLSVAAAVLRARGLPADPLVVGLVVVLVAAIAIMSLVAVRGARAAG